MRETSFGELMAEADRFGREAALQLVSPAIVGVDGRAEPFPVLQPIFEHYISVWNSFSETGIDAGQANIEGLAHVLVKDFKLSCLATPFGAGSQGWMRLKRIEKGRTEEEIGLFDGLVGFLRFTVERESILTRALDRREGWIKREGEWRRRVG